MTISRDPAALAAIHGASFRNPRPWNGDEIGAVLSGAGAFLLAEPGSFLIGRAIAGDAELLTLAVLPEHRRQGTGARLVAAFLAEALKRGAETAFLEVAADNAPALSLYRRLGFTEVGRRRGYYRTPPDAPVDAIVMRRRTGGLSQET